MSGILVAGTSSDAGKSLVVTALCRAAWRRGIDVVPYKAQNMSNNSMVCPDGSEIGRAQYLQASAARVTPESAMNPVLLKPGTDRRSFIVLRGTPGGVLEAGQYATGRRHLAEAAWAAYDELSAAHDMVICEGAGSPAEINLRAGDYTNMGLAREKSLPVVLVGDIDRGGVLASLFGTWALLDDADRSLLAGYVINKFRGDESVLAPGLEEITRRTGMPSFGVLPWVPEVWLDGEDALEVGRWRHDGNSVSTDDLRVAVVRLPRISNATDVDAMAAEAGVDVQVTTNPNTCELADVLVLPGSRSTVRDLEWLRSTGIAEVVARRARQGRTVLGICGGPPHPRPRGSGIADRANRGTRATAGRGDLRCRQDPGHPERILAGDRGRRLRDPSRPNGCRPVGGGALPRRSPRRKCLGDDVAWCLRM